MSDTFNPTSIDNPPSIAIIGGGVAGLSVAWQALKMGCAVTVYDKGTLCDEATNAAAGMLATGVETEPGEENLLHMNLYAQQLWGAFKSQLEKDSGHNIAYKDEGTIVAAINRDDLRQVQYSYEFQKSLGLDLQWLSGAELRDAEPYIHPNCTGGYYSPKDHQVDNRDVGIALQKAVQKLGGTVYQNTAVDDIAIKAGKATGVLIQGKHGGEHRAYDNVVLAAGAWSGSFDLLPVKIPVRPVKGQMLSLQMDVKNPLVTHVLWAPKIYLVPRNDGRLIIGATVEEKGFDTDLTAGGIFALLESAWRAVPAIEELPFVKAWVGHRPGCRDDAPIFGGCDIDGLILATGFHRNGILQAPVTAQAIAQFIRDKTLPDAVQKFTLQRFTKG